MNSKSIGMRIEQLRREKGISPETLAAVLGVLPAHVTAYEMGEKEIPVEVALRLCSFFHISMDSLAERQTAEQALPPDCLSAQEQALVQCYRGLNNSQKERTVSYVARLLNGSGE